MLAHTQQPDDAGLLVLLIAGLGAWFILVGFCHLMVWVAWRLRAPMPGWMEEHLHDEWGQR